MFNQKKSINFKILIKDITVSNSTTLVRLHLDKVSPNLLTRFLKAEPVPEESDTLMYRSDERSRVEAWGRTGKGRGELVSIDEANQFLESLFILGWEDWLG